MAKELFSVAAIVLTFAIFVPYIRSIRRGLTKPHVFSCVIWALCIRLPRPTLADADALFAIGCDPEVARYADWLTENLASARALEKAGMQREGTTQCCTDAFIMRGERVVSRYRVDL